MEDSHKHFVGPVAQKAILARDGKVLITREVGDQGTWELPGGRMHADETPAEGLRREVQEELGIDVEIGRVVYVEQFMHSRSQKNHLLIAYEVTIADPLQEFVPDPAEVHEMKWIGKSQLYEQKIFDNCLHALEAYFK